MNLPIAVCLPLLVGPWLVPLAARFGRSTAAWTAAAITAGALALVCRDAGSTLTGQTLVAAWPWFPQFGLTFSFRLDGLSLLFAGLILGIGLLVILYTRYYLSERDSIGKLLGTLMFFMGAMLGVVLCENLLLMFVFWELTSLSSFLLVGYWKHEPDARQGARMALAVTGSGGLCLLGGLLLLREITGSLELSTVLAANGQIVSHPLYMPMLVLILLGAFTKSAQFPFHFWLPHAMAAPTPVSTYLHSATMVKAGIFLLARLYPALSGTDLFFYLVSGVGLVTLTFGACVAIFQHDLKGLLAYSTVSHLGLVTFLIGLESPLSTIAALFHIVNHATFKASLFMAAGIIDHETGTRDMRKLNGLFHCMPITATLAMVAASAMAGVPLLNGFLSKEMFFGETAALRGELPLWWIVPIIATFAGACAVAYSIRFVHDVFFNRTSIDLPKKPHEPPRWMRLPVELLVLACIVVGLAPEYVVAPILNVAAAAVLNGPPPTYSLALWHGFNLPLAMSAAALIIGSGFYFGMQKYYDLHRIPEDGGTGRALFEKLIEGIVGSAERLTDRLANGSLQRYLALFVVSALAAGALPFANEDFRLGNASLPPVDGSAAIVWILLVAAAAATVWFHRQRFTALVMLGIGGLASAVIFMALSAPDLALTQISVEVVSVILMLVALFLLPQEAPREGSVARRTRNMVLAIAAGAGVAALTYAVLTRPHQSLAWFYLRESVPGGGGTNAVNVILVDFRGFDTFGEITVLAIASIVVYALLRTLHPVENPQLPEEDQHPLLLRVAARIGLPFALLVSAYLFLRGHNQPGGGFVAGLVTSIALVIQYLAHGIAWAEQRMNVRFYRVSGAGLLIAGVTGIASFFFAAPFLTSAHGHPHVPVLGEVPLASAALFDLGVFLAVVGAIVLSLTALSGVSRKGAA